MSIRGSTRICQIIGHPIDQVRSPDLFNDRAAELGVDVALVPIDVEPGHVPAFVALARGWRNTDGFVVTVPHKRAVAGLLDVLTPRARRLGAVNVVRRHGDGRLEGDMLDGIGCLAAARRHGFEPAGRNALVIGVGGAGSAIADALCEAGIARLALRDTDPGRLDAVRSLLGAAFPAVELLGGPDGLGGFDLVVNASPVGMGADDGLPVPAGWLDTLRPGVLVADVVTKPPRTPFVRAAEARGCRVQTGPEMVAGQLDLLARFMGAWT